MLFLIRVFRNKPPAFIAMMPITLLFAVSGMPKPLEIFHMENSVAPAVILFSQRLIQISGTEKWLAMSDDINQRQESNQLGEKRSKK